MQFKLKNRYIALAILLIGGTLPFNGIEAIAGTEGVNYEKNVVTFNESTSSYRTKTMPLPREAILGEVTTDTGQVSWVRSNDELRLTVSGGKSTGSTYDAYKYSQQAISFRTSSNTSFPSSVSYSSNGYSGTLYKDGSYYVTSGSYTPSDTKFVSGQTSSSYNSGGYSGSLSSYLYSGSYSPSSSKTETDSRTTSAGSSTSTLPTSISYNSGGYSGTLNKSGSATLISGTYTASSSKYVSKGPYTGYSTFEYSCTSRKVWSSNGVIDRSNWGQTLGYSDSQGYSGSLARDESGVNWGSPSLSGVSCSTVGAKTSKRENHTNLWFRGTVTKPSSDTRVYRQNYSGTVTKPSSDTRVYRYQGYVTRPESDTRVYRQDYEGTVYSGGYYSTYSYVVTVYYLIDREAPTGNLSKNEEWTNKIVTIRISNVQDTGGSLYHSMTLPSGIELSDTETTYVVSENGDYRFVLKDNAGNERFLVANVRNIDKKLPIIKFYHEPTLQNTVNTTIQIIDIGDSK